MIVECVCVCLCCGAAELHRDKHGKTVRDCGEQLAVFVVHSLHIHQQTD